MKKKKKIQMQYLLKIVIKSKGREKKRTTMKYKTPQSN